MTGLQRPTQSIVWELRSAWATGRSVRLTLSDRCVIPRVVGRVQGVAVTGAFVTIDGWHVPSEDILSVGRATVEEIDAYRNSVRDEVTKRNDPLGGG